MGRAHHDYVTHRGILSQRFIAQDRTFDFLGANAVARDVDDVIGTTMQRERAFITPTRVITLCVRQFVIPTLEVHLGEAKSGGGVRQELGGPLLARGLRVGVDELPVLGGQALEVDYA